jgi:hypothetical protein
MFVYEEIQLLVRGREIRKEKEELKALLVVDWMDDKCCDRKTESIWLCCIREDDKS